MAHACHSNEILPVSAWKNRGKTRIVGVRILQSRTVSMSNTLAAWFFRQARQSTSHAIYEPCGQRQPSNQVVPI